MIIEMIHFPHFRNYCQADEVKEGGGSDIVHLREWRGEDHKCRNFCPNDQGGRIHPMITLPVPNNESLAAVVAASVVVLPRQSHSDSVVVLLQNYLPTLHDLRFVSILAIDSAAAVVVVLRSSSSFRHSYEPHP